MEPKLPKIKPNIQPNNIVRASRGSYGGVKPKGVNPLVRNITGSDNLFSQLRKRNPEVSNKRGTRTLFNMLGTFGTERNEKIIRMNLQLLRILKRLFIKENRNAFTLILIHLNS